MKTLLSILLTVTIFSSCTRDTPSNLLDGSIQYKVNGSLVTISNQNITNGEYAVFFKQLQGTAIPHTRYMFNGQKGSNNGWVFGIQTDSLRTQNYTYDSTYLNTSGIPCTMIFNGQMSSLFYSGDNLIINITSYYNSLISGNFSARFTPLPFGGIPDYSTRGTTVITEGQFRNIKCTY